MGAGDGPGQTVGDRAPATGHFLTAARWSPYLVGAGIGVLSWLAFLFLDKPLGCSTAFSHTAGLLGGIVCKERVRRNPYYQKTPPAIDWQWMLVVGILLGALASSCLSGQFRVAWVPDLWAARFGGGAMGRWLAALAGGVCMGFGARWAGGCTSGHGISGILQLAVSGWVSAACFFIGGIATAMAVYR